MRKKPHNPPQNRAALVPQNTLPLFTSLLASQYDVIALRHRVRQMARRLSLDETAQMRIAAATCEMACNAFMHASGGKAECLIDENDEAAFFCVRISDTGAGLANLAAVLSAKTDTGIAAARQLVQRFEMKSSPEGTVALLGMVLPQTVALASPLPLEPPCTPLQEVHEQNNELISSLLQLQHLQSARQAGQMTVEYLSQLGHKLRSPLNSALSLTGFLLDRADGDLNAEQEKQVHLIRRSVEALSLLINEMLAVAGGVAVRAEPQVP